MSKRWKVVNKQTGEPWMPDSSITRKQLLQIMGGTDTTCYRSIQNNGKLCGKRLTYVDN